ncbi:hypothetical protein V6N11_031408 [Hibiscus sabdariffa]|uniref:Uncharacterized protein n=1 Tax=Hibiscus sabdariffa TaxID=183260 RepID=A0ABR2SXQ5_9ROSI
MAAADVVNPGGRLPDVVPAIQSILALEQSTSPSSVQEQPVSRKNKTVTIDGDVVQEMVMDTVDDVLPLHSRTVASHEEPGTGNAGDVDTDQGKKESYSSMAAKSSGAGERGKSAATLTNEEVIILEEDEACVKGMEAALGGVGQEFIQNPEPTVTIFESNLFGPWMVVEHRRRKPVVTGRDVEPAMQDFSNNRGSRFAALKVPDDIGLPGSKDEIMQGVTRTVEADVRSGEGRTAPPRMVVHKNTAYVASNPMKKSRNGHKMTSQQAVLPIVEGQVATVVSRKAQVQGGNYTVVLIQEHNERGLSQSMSRGGRRVVRRGASTSVSGFIDSVVGELDKIVEDTGMEGNIEHLMSEDESSWTDFQNEDDGDPALLDPDGGADGQ